MVECCGVLSGPESPFRARRKQVSWPILAETAFFLSVFGMKRSLLHVTVDPIRASSSSKTSIVLIMKYNPECWLLPPVDVASPILHSCLIYWTPANELITLLNNWLLLLLISHWLNDYSLNEARNVLYGSTSFTTPFPIYPCKNTHTFSPLYRQFYTLNLQICSLKRNSLWNYYFKITKVD